MMMRNNIERRQQALGWLQFCMCVIKKLKHQVYKLLEGDQREEQNEIPNIKDNEQHGLSATRVDYNQTNHNHITIDDIDGLSILQSGIFEKYQSMINGLIHHQEQSLNELLEQQKLQLLQLQQSSSQELRINNQQEQLLGNNELRVNNDGNRYCGQQQQCQLQLQSNIKPMGDRQQQQKQQIEGNITMRATNKLVLNLLQQLKNTYPNQAFNHCKTASSSCKQSQSSSIEQNGQNLSQLIKSIQSQPELLLLHITNNTLTIKLKQQQQEQQYQSSQQEQFLQQQQYQQQPQLQPSTKYLSAQRQLQLLIKQKQLNKKLSQTLLEIDELKNLLQEKDLLISQKDNEINQLKKDKLNIMKTRSHNNVMLLKHKVQTGSIIREICLQRERDSMEMFIEKENLINANNIDAILNINTNKKPPSYTTSSSINSTSKFPSKQSSTKIPT